MSLKRYYKLLLLSLVFVLTAIALFMADPIAQDLAYHRFSDARTMLGIPHFMDVVSNLPFIIIGIMGFRLVTTNYKRLTMADFMMGFTLFSGVFLIGAGSAFYHYSPDNFTLIFDRLPMTLVFTSFFTVIIYDYVDRRVGATLFYLMLAVGVYSILYWYYTEITGRGDLRLYAFVQFFPVVATPLILVLYRNTALYTRTLITVFIAYAIAKLLEHYDVIVFEWLQVISGHTLKHLFAALATWFIYKVFQQRYQQNKLVS